MRSIDLRTATSEELAAWGAEFDAAVEDGSLREEIEATIDPERNAKYGDKAWYTALVLFGYLSPADADAQLRELRDKKATAAAPRRRDR